MHDWSLPEGQQKKSLSRQPRRRLAPGDCRAASLARSSAAAGPHMPAAPSVLTPLSTALLLVLQPLRPSADVSASRLVSPPTPRSPDMACGRGAHTEPIHQPTGCRHSLLCGLVTASKTSRPSRPPTHLQQQLWRQPRNAPQPDAGVPRRAGQPEGAGGVGGQAVHVAVVAAARVQAGAAPHVPHADVAVPAACGRARAGVGCVARPLASS
jgi:hypothetical protein